MKKTFLFSLLAMVAIVMGSCKQEEPTAVLSEKMTGQVTVVGYVRITKDTGSGASTSNRAGQEVKIFRGTKTNEVMNYECFTATTDSKGRFEINLGCPAGKKIDEVMAVASAYVANSTKVGDNVVGGYFYGVSSVTNLVDGKAYEMIINMAVTDAKDSHKF